jgi:tripartite-type tricarboxylate transporter receptor subunit TctC
MKTMLKMGLVLAVAAVSASTLAQGGTTWPVKPLRLVVPFPAGSPNDILARLLAPELQQSLGQTIVVDNRPGASGNIGMVEALRANDEHTVLVGVDTMLTLNPHVFKKLSFKPTEDFTPVTQMATFSQMLVCHPQVPARNLQELLALSRRQPMSYASGGLGTPGHMAMEMLLTATQTPMNHVPYKGPGPALQDIVGNSVPCGFLSASTVGPFVRDGKVKAMAVSGHTRLDNHPAVPTVAESGVKGYDATFSEIVAMPRSTPPGHLQKLQQAVATALAKPEIRAKVKQLDLEPLGNGSEDARHRLMAENAKWGAVVARIALQMD